MQRYIRTLLYSQNQQEMLKFSTEVRQSTASISFNEHGIYGILTDRDLFRTY